MDIFPSLLSDDCIKFFEPRDFVALGGVLNDYLAEYIKNYIMSDDGDAEVKAILIEHLGALVESLTFHYTIKNLGIIELINNIIPETILKAEVDLTAIQSHLKFIEDRQGMLRTFIPPRKRDKYDAFYNSIRCVLGRMQQAGVTPKYRDMLLRIESNKSTFYTPNDKGHSTGCGVVNSKYRQWVTCLRGLEYKQYCDNKKMDYISRRLF